MRFNLTQIFLILIVVLGVRCNELEFIKPNAKKNWIEKINVQNEKELVDALKSIGIQNNPNGRTSSTNFGDIELNEGIKVYDSANNAVRYSLKLDTKNLLFENLVVSKKNGKTSIYILQMEPDVDWVKSNTKNDLSSFTGSTRQLDLNRKVIREKVMLNGTSVSTNGRTQECCSWQVLTSTTTGLPYWEIKCGEDLYISFKIKDCGGGDSGGDPGTGNTGDGPPSGGTTGGDTSGGGTTGGSGTTSGSGDKVGYFMTDEDWERLNRIAEVENLIAQDPTKLVKIPCTELPKWQPLAQNEASEVIKNKINQLHSNAGWFETWAIQTLNGADGTIVNMDYFSVNVSTLPNNPETDAPFTAEDFLTYFRTNINDFVEGSTFSPYCNTPEVCTQETNLWNSNAPTGAIIYIDIPGDDGVVVCSESTSSYWNFMTLEAPGAGNHPVSGTRQFGFESDGSGGYNFFVRGVDRFDSNIVENTLYMATLGGNPFFGADALWGSFQNKLNEFVNSKGGIASVNTPVKYRPDWDTVKAVLEGSKPISDLGCK